MKSLSFFTLLLALVFCTTGCVEQLETNLIATETKIDDKGGNFADAAPPYIHSITDQCGKLGAYEKVVVKDAQYSSIVHVDVYEENGQHKVRYTKANPNYLTTLKFNVGYPVNGSKDCSILTPGATYRIQSAANNAPITNWNFYNWPASHINDSFTTIAPCDCTI